jgi:hypothetical protein
MNAFQLLFIEGAFATAFDTWTGPIYLSGLAGEMGVGVGLLSLISIVPWIGAIGQFIGLRAYHRSSSTRAYVVVSAAIARALWLITILMGWFWGIQAAHHHQPFPARNWFLLAGCVGLLSQLFGCASASAWMLWMRALISPQTRGRFFGARQRYAIIAVIAAHFMGLLWAGWAPGGYPVGYGILLSGAVICAGISTLVLNKVPNVVLDDRSIPEQAPGWIETIRKPLKNRAFRQLVIFNTAFQFSIQIAGPFFPYYFTKELHISMSSVAFWTLLTNVGWFISAMYWGRRVDRVGGWRMSLLVTGSMLAISPIFYVFTSATSVRIFAPLEYFVNGIFWAGYMLVYTKLQLERSPLGSREGLFAFAVAAAAAAVGSAVGNLAGAQLASLLLPWGGFRALFLLTTILRMSTVWGLGLWVLKCSPSLEPPAKNALEYKDRIVREVLIITRGVVHGVMKPSTLFAKHGALDDEIGD